MIVLPFIYLFLSNQATQSLIFLTLLPRPTLREAVKRSEEPTLLMVGLVGGVVEVGGVVGGGGGGGRCGGGRWEVCGEW